MIEIDTTNRFMVASQGDTNTIRVMHPPTRQQGVSKQDALVFAAWLVTMADDSPDNSQFQEILHRVVYGDE